MPGNEDDFFYRDRPRSAAEAVSRKPEGREINVVKAAIQAYISRWLIPDTFQNRLLLEHAPRLSQFVQNRSGARNIHFDLDPSWASVDEENTRKVQVARFIEKLHRKFPAILIIDGGFRSRTAGLGDIQGARFVGNIQSDYDLVTDLVVNLEIMIIAEDDATCNDLSTLVACTLGPPLRRFGGGNQISGTDINNSWQITLPMENDISPMSREQLGGEDAQAQAWTASMSIEVQYDSVSTIRSGVPTRRGLDDLGSEGTGIVHYTIDGSPDGGVAFSGPDYIGPFHPTRFPLILTEAEGVEILPKPHWKLGVSDHRIATLDPHTMVLRPKKLGTVELQLRNERKEIIARKTVGIGEVPATIVTPLVNTVLPVITGIAQASRALTCDTGTWTGGPSYFTYRWYADGVPIYGAMSSVYLLTEDEVGKFITCAVTAHKSGTASVTATSVAVGPVTSAADVPTVAPTAISTPTILGTGVVGSPLYCDIIGCFSGSALTSASYSWFVNGIPVGADLPRYVPVDGDVGGVVTCIAIGTNGAGSDTAPTATGPTVIASHAVVTELFDPVETE